MSQGTGKSSAINIVFIFFVVAAVLLGAATGRMREVTDESFAAAKSAVTLAIGLIGIMALWLGLVRVLEAGGLMYALAEAARPFMQKLFPEIPRGHPAMSAILLNLSANALGLGNAATPLGIKAMVELNKLNPLKGTATNSMCLFLAINTSSITLLPLGVIGVRAAAGAARPADIFLPTLIATGASTVAATLFALFMARRDRGYLRQAAEARLDAAAEQGEAAAEERESYAHLRVAPSRWQGLWALLIALCFAAALGYRMLTAAALPPQLLSVIGGPSLPLEPGVLRTLALSQLWPFLLQEFLSYWLMPGLMLLIVIYGIWHGVKIYEAVTEGAKQGFDIAVRIIPFLVAILVAIGMFRVSGGMELLKAAVSPLTGYIGLPAEALPMALLRPLSGSGAFAVMSELIQRAPDSYEAFVASVIMGCTETTFYVLAVYFGAVGVSKIRYAVAAGLLADIVGVVVASLVSGFFWSAAA